MTIDQLRAVLAVLEYPSATNDQLARFPVLSEIDSVDIQEVSSRVRYYEPSMF